MKINRKQFQELMLLATGFRISLDFEGYYILNYSGLHLYRCSETIILMNNGKESDTVKIEFSEDMEIIFDNEEELIRFFSLLMDEKISTWHYKNFLGNIYSILHIGIGTYQLVSNTLIVKCIMEVE